ncbi:oligomeric golgi complex component, COG2-domain-containing protein [Coprinopsis sp. MPI-PUGE-AT-0042]|nr:oligomeric golgi complex component, COG2-domain-containing protein [Coprinopsis sp. MPI-PUGE-AT-0042]
MAIPSQLRQSLSTQDPYELERLAEELETRERSYPKSAGIEDLDSDVPTLPSYVPLSHENPFLTAEGFNIEAFLQSRSYTSLPDLRTELREYLVELKEELVRLINDDYEAFISLSTDLRDEGGRLEALKRPLNGIRSQILDSKQDLQEIQHSVQEKLKKRSVLREEKALLQLLLKISDSVTRLEKLLAISSSQEDDDLTTSKVSLQMGHSDEHTDDKLPANRAKHLSRIATEYTQLLYHASKARLENCVFINGIQWRIDRIHSTLSSDLDSMFSTTLANVAEGKSDVKHSELDRTKSIADLTECLRTYDLLGLWRDAEDIIRRQVIRKFVRKTIFPGALDAPHSPLVPHTPFHPNIPEPLLTASFPGPQTPYTPFTAFIPKHNAHFGPRSSFQQSEAYLLDDSTDNLAHLYNQILRFIERDVCYLMDATESIKNNAANPEILDSNNTDSGFSLLSNVVWDELSRAIQDEIGGLVFSAGRPDEFRKVRVVLSADPQNVTVLFQHYETTQAFIRSLELLAPSGGAIEALRSHESFQTFERRWQLPVYFQLRWKEIIGKLEESLATQRLEPTYSKDISPFVTPQAAAVWVAISACWSAQVFIPELCSRFWRLTLQIISRYFVWTSACIDLIEVKVASDAKAPSNSTSSGRATTPVPGESSTPESSAADDGMLRQYSAAIVDILALDKMVRVLWDQEIRQMLPDQENVDEVQPEAALNAVLSKLTGVIPSLSVMVITILTRRCCDALLPMRSIPSQFRAMSSKRMPTEPSYFISGILRPLRQFFGVGADGPGAKIKDQYLKDYSSEVFNAITSRYINYLSAMKKTEESLKRLRKAKKPTYSLFGSSNTAEDDGRDEERIRAQMILDVEAFGKDARSLGVAVDDNEHFNLLKEMVYATDSQS